MTVSTFRAFNLRPKEISPEAPDFRKTRPFFWDSGKPLCVLPASKTRYKIRRNKEKKSGQRSVLLLRSDE